MSSTATGKELVEELARRFALVEGKSEYPPEVNRRIAVRYELPEDAVPVTVGFADGAEIMAGLLEISIGGARLTARQAPVCSEVVQLAFDLGDRRIILNGQVVHSGEAGETSYFGVRFTDLPMGLDTRLTATLSTD